MGMTENKRFHFGYVLGDTGLIDEQAEDKWFIENCCNVSDLKKNWKNVCDKLNEVADENEQLKQTNQRLNDELQETMGYLALKSGVEKENEQLKRQIGNLEHTKDFCADVCADCERLEKENEQLKQKLQQCRKFLNDDLDIALGFISHKGYSLKDLKEYEKKLKGDV